MHSIHTHDRINLGLVAFFYLRKNSYLNGRYFFLHFWLIPTILREINEEKTKSVLNHTANRTMRTQQQYLAQVRFSSAFHVPSFRFTIYFPVIFIQK